MQTGCVQYAGTWLYCKDRRVETSKSWLPIDEKLEPNASAQCGKVKFWLQSNKRNRKPNKVGIKPRSRKKEGKRENRNFRMLQRCRGTLRSTTVRACWQVPVYPKGVHPIHCAMKRALCNPFVLSKNKSPKEYLKVGQMRVQLCIPAMTCSSAPKQKIRTSNDRQPVRPVQLEKGRKENILGICNT